MAAAASIGLNLQRYIKKPREVTLAYSPHFSEFDEGQNPDLFI